MNSLVRQFSRLSIGGEVAITLLLVSILALMILPLPPQLIDALLAVNMAISVLLLMAALYAPSSTSLSSFPSLLLFTTLFRLALNIASTKAILLHADAGHIIDSFGNLVVGGNLIVGLVVFTIIAAVQFIVIAKGSERTSEVGARFALDAMPGQQMSIDAELRGGTMSAEDARKRRAQLAMESQLFGGMDGAMKFVKGDAIAGLVITVINITAGIAVGVIYHGMDSATAAQRFSVLAVGDAMVSQIPSLLISVAAGVLTTRVADKMAAQQSPLGKEIVRQLSNSSQAMTMAALMLVGFALVPGFPWVMFLLLAALLGWAGHAMKAKGRPAASTGESKDAMPSLRAFGAKGDSPTIGQAAPQFTSPVSIKLSPALGARLLPVALEAAFAKERARMEEELGLPFPGVAVWISQDLEGERYEVLLQEVPSGGGELPADATAEPALAEQVMTLISSHAHLFVGIQETQWMFDRLNASYQGLVTEVQKVLPLQKVSDVLRRLLEERVPIRNMRNILESLIFWGPKEKDVLVLTEYVRGDLGRFISHRATQGTGKLAVLTLNVSVEQMIRQSIKPTPTGNFLTLSEEDVQAITQRVTEVAGEAPREVAIVTAMDVRRYVRRLIEPRLKWLQVYSYQELSGHAQLLPEGEIEL